MSSDLESLMRAVKTIERLAHKYDHEALAAALLKDCSRKDREAVAFVGLYLHDVWREHLRGPDQASWPRCYECGRDIERPDGDPRADARYCSPKCRQRAYRKRVTASPSAESRKGNGGSAPLRMMCAPTSEHVTDCGVRP